MGCSVSKPQVLEESAPSTSHPKLEDEKAFDEPDNIAICIDVDATTTDR